jgi:hypothetical protein
MSALQNMGRSENLHITAKKGPEAGTGFHPHGNRNTGIATLNEEDSLPQTIAFSDDGRYLACGFGDHTLVLLGRNSVAEASGPTRSAGGSNLQAELYLASRFWIMVRRCWP